MGTAFDEIIDEVMIVINDYKLDNLIIDDEEAFIKVLDGYVVMGLPLFKTCLKSLEYTLDYDNNIREFKEELNMYEKNIIAKLAVIEWYRDNLQDVLEFKEALRDVDFNKYSTGQNLRPRQEYIKQLRTDIKQDMTDYELMNIGTFPYFSSYN